MMMSPDRKPPGIAKTYLGKRVEKILQPPAVLNLDLAQEVATEIPITEPLALDYVHRLSLYNFKLFNPQASPQQIQQFNAYMEHLSIEEQWAAHPSNPLHPLGWEVENSKKAFFYLRTIDPKKTNYQYKTFFDALGIPNVMNLLEDDAGRDMGVEIASYPAYSAGVAARLLSEFIKCGIIPSLRSSSDPGDIQQFLSDKLVSLHVNLGVPLDFDTSKLVGEETEERRASILSSSLAFGFSSTQRLKNKLSLSLHMWKFGKKEMIEIPKTSLDRGRLELKALEVRDKNVYRLLSYSQLLGAAFFASLGTKQTALTAEWSLFEDKISMLYKEFGINAESLHNRRTLGQALRIVRPADNVLQALDIEKKPSPAYLDSMNIQPFARMLLDDAALRIRRQARGYQN